MKQPWLKFYPADWRADMDLRTCTLAARGLWMEMLCVMSEAEPRGYMLRKGKPVSARDLAMFSGASVDEVTPLLRELDEAGVFSRDGQGRIFSRRMVRDEQKAERARENGMKGGNPALQPRIEENQPLTETLDKQPDMLSDMGGDKAQKLEARVPDKDRNLSVPCPKRVRTRNAYPDDFEAWWSAYPTDSNMSKAEASKCWQRLSEADKRDATASLSAFSRYCASRPDYRPVHANRYLTQRRWEGHLKAAEAVEQRSYFAHQESPQYQAWKRYRWQKWQKSTPVNDKGGWNFESEWPPKIEDKVNEAA